MKEENASVHFVSSPYQNLGTTKLLNFRGSEQTEAIKKAQLIFLIFK